MKIALIALSLIVNSQAVYASQAHPIVQAPQKCYEQAGQIADALEVINVAPAFKNMIEGRHATVKLIASNTVAGGVNHWTFRASTSLKGTDEFGREGDFGSDDVQVILNQNGIDDCYFVGVLGPNFGIKPDAPTKK